MFTDASSVSAAMAADHRATLLAEAGQFRLARLARAARREARRAVPPAGPPAPRREPVRERQTASLVRDDANRRYAVPR